MTKFKAILIMSSLLLVGALCLFIQDGCKAKKQVKQIQRAAVSKEDTGRKYRDRDSVAHMVKQVEPINNTTANILYKAKWEQAARELDMAKNHIEELTEINMELRGRLNTPITPVAPGDTSAPRYATGAFSWADSSIVVNGYILQRPIDSNCKGDSCLTETEAQLDYSVAITGKVRKYWQRKHRLPIFRKVRWGKKIHFIDVSADSKKIIITGLDHIQINN